MKDKIDKMEETIETAFFDFLKKNSDYRKKFFKKLIRISNPEDIIFFSNELDTFKKDFFTILPNEILEIIFEYLDWRTLLECCLVNINFLTIISDYFLIKDPTKLILKLF